MLFRYPISHLHPVCYSFQVTDQELDQGMYKDIKSNTNELEDLFPTNWRKVYHHIEEVFQDRSHSRSQISTCKSLSYVLVGAFRRLIWSLIPSVRDVLNQIQID